ncbi:protoporphyrinogen oxidase [Nocardia iowensis]|uniref:Coproporphyrinogen III oxidase n=1 Tax=Nocardia iowensis TaxID=204891 RepID=A0ABX8RVH7_NOCIO|nr:protoporphyrinogen oxidase [Nocardia iowensis]QXN93216.1 protoporphyrinogen oxidase [Nocardia iowensis]
MVDRRDVVVIGGGITGLTAAYEIIRNRPDASVTVLEATDRVGGIVGAVTTGRYVVDIGPHGFIDNGSDTRLLIDRLGISGDLIPATKEAAKISLLKDNRIYQIPGTLGQLLRTPLLSAHGKARLLSEVFVPPRHEEDSVIDFVTRRFGREVAEKFAVPAVRGVVGGDADNFSIEGEFPLIKELERKYGSVLIGAVRNQQQRHRLDPVSPRIPSFREFGNRLKTFRGSGMQHLVDTLAAVLGERIRLGTAVRALEHTAEGRWRVLTDDGPAYEADHALIALPSDAAVQLVRPHHAPVADALSVLPHPDIRVVALAYRKTDVARPPRGIGFIATPGLPSDLLGAIHASTIFPEQAPADQIMIRVLAGGLPDAPILTHRKERAVELIHHDLQNAFGLKGTPVFCHEHLWRRPIPTYPVGHRPLFRELLDSVAQLGGLHMAGNSYFGVGVNDCVRDARRAATGIIEALRSSRPSAAVGR